MEIKTTTADLLRNILIEETDASLQKYAGTAPVEVVRSKGILMSENVIQFLEPISIILTEPSPCVQYAYDPFYALYRGLWMLGGRNDVVSLAHYNEKMTRFSDDGKTLNGAYGYRWRHNCSMRPMLEESERTGDCVERYWHVNQLNILVDHLKVNPKSKKAVLQTWNVEDDLLKTGIRETTTHKNKEWRTYSIPSKDVCCNLSVMFSLSPVSLPNEPDIYGRKLDISIVFRDINFYKFFEDHVAFCFLHQYMAKKLCAEVGQMRYYINSFSTDLNCMQTKETLCQENNLIHDIDQFEKELPLFLETFSGTNPERKTYFSYQEPFFEQATQLMSILYQWKNGVETKDLVQELKRMSGQWPTLVAQHISS